MIELWSKAQIEAQFASERRSQVASILTNLPPLSPSDTPIEVRFVNGGEAVLREHRHYPGGGRAVIDIAKGPLLSVIYDNTGVTGYEQVLLQRRSVIVEEFVSIRDR